MSLLLYDLGNLEADQGDFDQARALHEESLALRRELGTPRGIAHSLAALGYVVMLQGDYERAEALLEESVALWRQLEQPWRLADALVTLGYAAVDRTCYERAQTLLEEGLTLYTRNGAQTEIALCLEAFAALAGGTRQPERAVRLWGAAAALRETLGYPLAPTEQVHHDRRVAAVRAQLDEATWQQAWTEGRAMPLDQAIAYALEDEAEAGVVN